MTYYLAWLWVTLMLMTGVQSPDVHIAAISMPIFKVERLPDALQIQMQDVSYREGAPVELEELRLLTLSYYDYSETPQIGELVVHQSVAEDIKDIFKSLYEARYPISKMKRIDAYGGDDGLSMADNNTSAFNHRKVAGSSKLSLHAYGLAIDINPIENPYVTDLEIAPTAGKDYLDRTLTQKGMIHKGDLLYEAFISKGWQWGGEWKSVKDYQHFQKKIKEIIEP